MQTEPVTYLHAGMIQHDPNGNPTFLHRTAEGKVYPFHHGYRKVSSAMTVFLCALSHQEKVKDAKSCEARKSEYGCINESSIPNAHKPT